MIRFLIAVVMCLLMTAVGFASDGPVRNFFRNVDARQDARFVKARAQALQVQPLCVQKVQAVQYRAVQPVVFQQSYHVQPVAVQQVQQVVVPQYQAVQKVVVQKQATGCAAFFTY